jgi:signal peptidase I
VVPEGKLFTMGDNRDESNDSRFWGFVDEKAVRGKAFMIYWSWNREDFGVRWNRLGDVIR